MLEVNYDSAMARATWTQVNAPVFVNKSIIANALVDDNAFSHDESQLHGQMPEPVEEGTSVVGT
jgi:hypothetical protein